MNTNLFMLRTIIYKLYHIPFYDSIELVWFGFVKGFKHLP